LCDRSYDDGGQIMNDVTLARRLAANEGKYMLYDKSILAAHRNSLQKS
jgi:hypothetical protein